MSLACLDVEFAFSGRYAKISNFFEGNSSKEPTLTLYVEVISSLWHFMSAMLALPQLSGEQVYWAELGQDFRIYDSQCRYLWPRLLDG